MTPRQLVITAAAALAIVSAAAPANAQARERGSRKAKQTDTPKEPATASTEAKAPALPEVAPSSPAGVFGTKRQITISSDAGLSIENTSLSGAEGSTTRLTLHPAIDYFVIDNLSVGGFLGLDYTSNPGGNSTRFSIGPRVGYNISFSERWSVWPKLGFSFASTSQSVDVPNVTGTGTTKVDTSNTALALNIFAPVLFHPVEHFFIGFGPAFDVDLSGDNKSTTVGGRLSTGGWF